MYNLQLLSLRREDYKAPKSSSSIPQKFIYERWSPDVPHHLWVENKWKKAQTSAKVPWDTRSLYSRWTTLVTLKHCVNAHMTRLWNPVKIQMEPVNSEQEVKICISIEFPGDPDTLKPEQKELHHSHSTVHSGCQFSSTGFPQNCLGYTHWYWSRS